MFRTWGDMGCAQHPHRCRRKISGRLPDSVQAPSLASRIMSNAFVSSLLQYKAHLAPYEVLRTYRQAMQTVTKCPQ